MHETSKHVCVPGRRLGSRVSATRSASSCGQPSVASLFKRWQEVGESGARELRVGPSPRFGVGLSECKETPKSSRGIDGAHGGWGGFRFEIDGHVRCSLASRAPRQRGHLRVRVSSCGSLARWS